MKSHREKQIKGWSRNKKEALIAGRFDKLSDLAKNRSDVKNTVASTGSATTAPAASTGSAVGNDTAIEPAGNGVIEPVEMTGDEE